MNPVEVAETLERTFEFVDLAVGAAADAYLLLRERRSAGSRWHLFHRSTDGRALQRRTFDEPVEQLAVGERYVALVIAAGGKHHLELLERDSLATVVRRGFERRIRSPVFDGSGRHLCLLEAEAVPTSVQTSTGLVLAESPTVGCTLLRLRVPSLADAGRLGSGVVTYAIGPAGLIALSQQVRASDGFRTELSLVGPQGHGRRISGLAAATSLKFNPLGSQLALLGTETPGPLPEYPGLRPAVVDVASGTLQWRGPATAITRGLAAAADEIHWLDTTRFSFRNTAAGNIHLKSVGASPRVEGEGPWQVLAHWAKGDRRVTVTSASDCSLEVSWSREGAAPSRVWRPNTVLDRFLSGTEHQQVTFDVGGSSVSGYAWGAMKRSSRLVLSIHGGPHGFTGSTLSLTHFYRWLLARRGCVVLSLNPTGSGGCGEELLRRGRGQWGTTDLQEYLTAVRRMFRQGLAGGPRFAVCGFSYGGYLAAKLLEVSQNIDAAVIGAPVVDLRDWFAASDIGPAFLGWHFGHRRPGFLRRLEGASARAARRRKARVLLIQGLADARCPPSGARSLASAYWRSGTPAQLVEYPGEGHALPASPRLHALADYHSRVTAFISGTAP